MTTQEDPFAPLLMAMHHTSTRWLRIGVVVTALGWGIFVLQGEAGSTLTRWSSVLFGALLMCTGPIILLKGWQYRRGQKSHLIRSLHADPNQVVWIYNLGELSHSAHTSRILMLHLEDQTRYFVHCPPQLAEKIKHRLRSHCPSLLVGFTKERELAFSQDPSLLRKQ